MLESPLIQYLGIMESSTDPSPLFGTPTLSGDSLVFPEANSQNPSSGFIAEASDGTADVTSGSLNLTIEAHPMAGAVASLELSVAGNYKLQGPVGGEATASVILDVVELKILEVDFLPINPISLTEFQSDTFALSGDTSSGPWHLSSAYNLTFALLNNGESFIFGATRVSARVNVAISSVSQTGTASEISVKDFRIDPGFPLDPNQPICVPEPSSSHLCAVGLASVFLLRKASRGRR